MKTFQIEIALGRTDVDGIDQDIDREQLQTFLESSLESVLGLFDGGGRVWITETRTGAIDVKLLFMINAESKAEALRRFMRDFELLEKPSSSIAVNETKTFRCLSIEVDGERFSMFIRFNPETGKPMYTDD